jgi:GT2 family glycosyltransferase
MLRIAVLMTCFNRKAKTLQCLQALFSQKDLGQTFLIQVFLVDDNSTDGTAVAVANSFPTVKIIKGDGSLFWNRGMHTAWKFASRESFPAYLWLNDDTQLYECALSEMIAAVRQTDFKAVICGSTESPTKKGQLTYGGGKHKDRKYVSNYPNGSICPCDIINGNCVLVPQYVFEIIGNLDWKFNHGIGDNDYGLRAKKLGIKSFTTPSFIGTCSLHETLPKWCLPQVQLKERLRNFYSPLGNPPREYFIFEKRHFGLTPAILHYLTNHLRVLFPTLWK